MSKAKGFILLNRSVQSNWLWEDKPFSKGQAWIDLLMLANFEDKKMPYKGKVIVCKRGDVNISITAIAERWGWGREKTTKFLRTLQSDNMIVINATTNRTTLTIVNYAKFQDVPTTNHATNRQRVEQRADSEPSITNNIYNNSNNYKESAGAPPIKQMDGFTHVKRVRGGDWYINDANGDKHYEPW